MRKFLLLFSCVILVFHLLRSAPLVLRRATRSISEIYRLTVTPQACRYRLNLYEDFDAVSFPAWYCTFLFRFVSHFPTIFRMSSGIDLSSRRRWNLPIAEGATAQYAILVNFNLQILNFSAHFHRNSVGEFKGFQISKVAILIKKKPPLNLNWTCLQ